MTTLVTGATGRIGTATLAALVDADRDPVALVRSPERAAALTQPVDSRVGDLADPRSLDDAFESVHTLLLCSGHAPTMAELQLNAIVAARRAGVQRIVKISTSPASAFAGTPSQVAAAALTSDGPLPAHIEVTGPQALSGDQLAELLTEATGRAVAYRPISEEENRTRLLAAGAPAWLAEHVITIFALLRDGDGDRVTDAVREWTGRPATTMAEVLARDERQLGITAAVAAGRA